MFEPPPPLGTPLAYWLLKLFYVVTACLGARSGLDGAGKECTFLTGFGEMFPLAYDRKLS